MGIAIVVVTGHPFRGKTDVAEKIAKWLGCPTLFMEGILEALRPCVLSYAFTEGPLEGLLQQPSSSRKRVEEEEEEAKHLAGTALRIFFCQVTYLIRSVDASNGCVVLEFPVSSPTVLEILIELLDNQSLDRGLIIECMPPTKTNLSDLLEVERPGVWYHHDTWADIEMAIKREHHLMSSKFDDDEELSPTNLVSTLKIDPATDFNFLKDPPRRAEGRPVPSAFFEAVEYLIFKRDVVEEGPLFITMRQWGALRYKLLRLGEKGSTGRLAPCFKGASYHDIIYTTQTQTELIDEPAECSLCGELVKDSAYKCTCCLLHLHKDCGELVGTTRDSLPPATHDWRTFPETHVCTSCKEHGINDFSFSKDCKSCLFTTFLKCRLRPVVIHHPFLQDFLQIQVSSEADANIFDSCAACGQRLHFGIRYFYRHASLYYGFSCTALMALELEHVHFGYKHPLKLRREPYHEFDSYICHVCCRERYPHHWFYYCEECDYEAHVYCIYSSIAANYH